MRSHILWFARALVIGCYLPPVQAVTYPLQSICSPTVRIIAFQAIDPGSTPGRRIRFHLCLEQRTKNKDKKTRNVKFRFHFCLEQRKKKPAMSNSVSTFVQNKEKNSVAGTRTRVSRVRAEYPDQLDYNGTVSILTHRQGTTKL